MSDSPNPIDALNDAINAAAQNPEFRTLLLTDAHAALKALGGDFPAEVDFKVEERDGKFGLVLPETPAAADLSNAELERIVGGSGILLTAQCNTNMLACAHAYGEH